MTTLHTVLFCKQAGAFGSGHFFALLLFSIFAHFFSCKKDVRVMMKTPVRVMLLRHVLIELYDVVTSLMLTMFLRRFGRIQ